MNSKKIVGFCGRPAFGRPGSPENTGNYIHGYAARRIVGEHLNVSYKNAGPEQIEKLRNQLSHLAFVAATTIGLNKTPKYADKHLELSKFIEALNVPVIVFGLGTNARLGKRVDDAQVHPNTQRLLSVLSAHTPTIAVRGEFTADICQRLGINNVEFIGCQSCFLNMDPNFKYPSISEHLELSRFVINVTKYRTEWPIILEAMSANATFIGQSSDFEYRLKANTSQTFTLHSLPSDLAQYIPSELQQLFGDNSIPFDQYQKWIRARFHQFYDAAEWLSTLSGRYDFSIGTRFHGNMASLQAGVPALWLVHDMRTHEFCKLLGLPNAPAELVRNGVNIRDLVERYFSTDAFNRVYPENYARFYAYLEKHGVPHKLPRSN